MSATPLRAADKLRTVDDQLEKWCTSCHDWWPADNEFFYSDHDGIAGLAYCCKACFSEYLQEREAKRQARKQLAASAAPSAASSS